MYIDGHNDLLMQLWLKHPDQPEAFFFGRNEEGHLDFPRIKRGRLGAALFAIFVPPESYVAQHFPHRLPALQDKVQVMWQQLAILERLERFSAGRAKICRTAVELQQCLHQDVLGMVAHIEGADALDTDGELLQAFQQAGVRSCGPFWNTPNAFGEGITGSFPGSPDSGPGLTPEGIRFIRQLQSLKMLTDVSHMNQRAFYDTACYSQQPLVATHSNAHALCPQPRNLTDEQLKVIAQSGGLVGVNFGNAFLRSDGRRDENTPLTEITRHLCYLIDTVGEDHVGFGSDFDGTAVPTMLKDVTGMTLIEQSLYDEGVSERVIRKVCHGNWLRILNHFMQ